MSGLNNAETELSLGPESACGSGTGIPSAVCEGKHHFNRKRLHLIHGTFIDSAFYISVPLTCGRPGEPTVAYLLLLFVFPHSRGSSQTVLTGGRFLFPNPSLSSSFPLSPLYSH